VPKNTAFWFFCANIKNAFLLSFFGKSFSRLDVVVGAGERQLTEHCLWKMQYRSERLLKGRRRINLRKNNIIITAVVAIVIVVGASVAWIYLTSLSEQEKARDSTISFIKTNHPETASLIGNFKWEGGIRNNYQEGVESYIYSSQGWTVIIQFPPVQKPVYTIQAVCTSGAIVVNWHGSYQDGIITETSYTKTP
jgi:hypothetical protein